ncbi:hypothetical protein PV08_06992 [Exophiala spinifera]|uniref:Uncharacterized protein n=1 Tax=Exophiala spinifera TaxID=91928 RepID=A0A0D1YGT8_9EURO|nr:uncharacterized protein PV08_06992 [Exophiala spinifera]KIW14211.1 hypothetical protein PV08_06992 [Exophiala spinifera]
MADFNDNFFIQSVLNSIDDLNQIDRVVAAELGLPPFPSFEDLLRRGWRPSSAHSNPAPATSSVGVPQRQSNGPNSDQQNGSQSAAVAQRGPPAIRAVHPRLCPRPLAPSHRPSLAHANSTPAQQGVIGRARATKRKSPDDEEEDIPANGGEPAGKRQSLGGAKLVGTTKELPGFPASKEPLPTDWTLELVVTKYPNHTLLPSVLDAFTQYFWTGNDIYKRFSPEITQEWNKVFPNQPGNALHKRLIGRWKKMGSAALRDLINAPKIVPCFAIGEPYFGKSNPGNLDLNPRAPRKPVKNE